MSSDIERIRRIEDLLDARLADIEDNKVESMYQSRDISYLSNALLTMIRIRKEREDE